MSLDLRWLAAALLLPFGVAQASVATDYAYAFALDTPNGQEAYRIVLTPAVYAASNPDAGLRDLVVLNAQGRPVPFGPMPSTSAASHAYKLETRLLPLPRASGGAKLDVRVERNANGDIVINQPGAAAPATERPTQWLFDAGREVSLEHIELEPSSLTQDFQLHLAVDASNDLRDWQTRTTEAAVTRVSNDGDGVEQLLIDVGGEPARYYRVRLVDGEVDWSAGHLPAIRLQGSYIDAVADRASQLQWQAIPANAASAGDYDYLLPASLPLEAVKVELPAGSTAARVHLLAQGDEPQAPWSELASLDLVQLGLRRGAVETRFAPRQLKRLRLHSDTPLAQAPTLSVGWLPGQFVFLAEGGGPYRLLAGSYAARRGEYPVDEALNQLRSSHDATWQPPVATLGARVDAAGAQALQAPKVPYDWTRPLLWLVLVAGAALVGGMALSLLRQSRRDSSS